MLPRRKAHLFHHPAEQYAKRRHCNNKLHQIAYRKLKNPISNNRIEQQPFNAPPKKEIQLENDLILSSENILGKKQNTTTYKTLGAVFNTLTSKWGYLFIIIFPMLIAFVYEIYAIFKEIKKKK